MKNMIWHPEPNDEKVNQYLEQANHAPYPTIFAITVGIFCAFTALVLMGVF
ncbi:conserved hypothetical protein [Hyella patelloides LEGE 07179]|uniref:Uncharacterized protein n=1 Tax=Hyella patelloides LEGE 07179 TaxID=945734 RepID=A0A563VP25_9CYAN|nr:hypothetical protein [Hyella patelloides]VEP13161.1 conserved hypothetical protein [Hyella patelloides LEGE 07179]